MSYDFRATLNLQKCGHSIFATSKIDNELHQAENDTASDGKLHCIRRPSELHYLFLSDINFPHEEVDCASYWA